VQIALARQQLTDRTWIYRRLAERIIPVM